MAFPRRLLNDREELVLDLHLHWWFFAGPLAALVGAVVLGILTLAYDLHTGLKITVGVLVLVALFWFAWRYAQWATTNFVVTSDRLIYRHGVLSKQGIEIPLDRVNTVFFHQSLFERLLKAGDLMIESAGEMGRQRFSNVRQPSAVQNEVYRQIEANENRKYDRVGAASAVTANATPPDDGPTIPEQIRELDELRKTGLLTDEEFARKKQELLDRM